VGNSLDADMAFCLWLYSKSATRGHGVSAVGIDGIDELIAARSPSDGIVRVREAERRNLSSWKDGPEN
jgi:hypothetical protein